MRAVELLVFMLPAYAANMAPPLVTRFWTGWNPPIARRAFGAHKTVLGFTAGVIAAPIVTLLAGHAGWLGLGLRFGLGAMLGDLAKSFVKRRVGIAPGHPWIPFDQLDFALGALALTAGVVPLTVLDVALVLGLTFVGHIAVNHVGHALGLRATAW